MIHMENTLIILFYCKKVGTVYPIGVFYLLNHIAIYLYIFLITFLQGTSCRGLIHFLHILYTRLCAICFLNALNSVRESQQSSDCMDSYCVRGQKSESLAGETGIEYKSEY